MSRWAVILVGLGLAAIPPVSAGSESEPELTDPADDQAPGATAAPETDILAAWWFVDDDTLNATLKVAKLEPTSKATYRLWWNRTDETLFHEMVLTADLIGDGYVRGESECVRRDGSRTIACLGRPTATWGTPGYLHWESPRFTMDMENGGAVFQNLSAQTWYPPHWYTEMVAGVRFDGDLAFSPTRVTIPGPEPGAPRELRVGPFPEMPPATLPGVSPIFEDENSSVPDVIDLRRVWFDFDDERVFGALEIDALTQAGIESCIDWRGSFDMYDYNTRQRFIFDWVIRRVGVGVGKDFTVENWSLDSRVMGGPHDHTSTIPGSVGFHVGTPGYMVGETTRAEWGPSDLSRFQLFRAEVQCGEQIDTFEHDNENALAPGLGGVALLLTLMGAILLRRRLS